jgi:aldehyde dehydrogenase (NAD+)
MATQVAKDYLNYIGGEWVRAGSKQTFDDTNPAHKSEIVGKFPKSSAQDVDDAITAASEAYKKWRMVPAPRRGEILFRAGQLLIERKEDIARVMTREMGKILKETRGDVQEGIDMAFYIAGEGRRLLGETTPSELPNKFAMTIRIPMGVCSVITPWNFPVAIPSWKIFPALIVGNTVVFKPASYTPASAYELVKVFEDAGLPKGVLNVVFGGGGELSDALLSDPRVKLVSFTGSCEVGKHIATVCGKQLKKCSMELGGKNVTVVMDDADLSLALEGVIWGAFGTTGQRCTATSRCVVHEKVYDKFRDMLLERIGKIKVGDGLLPDTEMGPCVSESQRETVKKYVDIAKKEGNDLLIGGKTMSGGKFDDGYYFEPTLFDRVEPGHTIFHEEIFGPVLALIKCKDLSNAIELCNNCKYGLSSSMYTNNVRNAFVAMRDIYTGITYINAPTIGAEVHLPFGGTNETGNGHREAGTTVLDIFSEWKTLYIDYSGKLQKAQIED